MSEVAPSFFPTPNEIAGGIRWVRDHPVVATAAAAAATAVSVITFLRSRALTEDDDQLQIADPVIDCAPFDSRDLDELPNPRERFQTWGGNYARKEVDANSSALLESQAKSRSHQEFTKLSSRKEAEEIYSNTDSDFSTVSRLSRRNSPPSSHALCDGVAAEDSPRGVDVPPTCIEGEHDQADEDDLESPSPQWGWYVSTTPPEEHYT